MNYSSLCRCTDAKILSWKWQLSSWSYSSPASGTHRLSCVQKPPEKDSISRPLMETLPWLKAHGPEFPCSPKWTVPYLEELLYSEGLNRPCSVELSVLCDRMLWCVVRNKATKENVLSLSKTMAATKEISLPSLVGAIMLTLGHQRHFLWRQE